MCRDSGPPCSLALSSTPSSILAPATRRSALSRRNVGCAARSSGMRKNSTQRAAKFAGSERHREFDLALPQLLSSRIKRSFSRGGNLMNRNFEFKQLLRAFRSGIIDEATFEAELRALENGSAGSNGH